jgi:hypothetical protein
MPAVCSITGTVSKLDGSPVVGAQVYATVRSTQADQGGQVASGTGVSSAQIEAFTGDAGEFSIQLIQGAVVLLEIPTINLRKEITVPALITADFVTLI